MTQANIFTPAALGVVYLLIAAIPLARIDAREHRLPNRLVVPAFPVTLVGQLASLILALAAGSWRSDLAKFGQAWLCALVTFALALLVNRYGSLGMGDVKLLAAIALALGWFSGFLVLVAVTAGFGLGVAGILVRGLLQKQRMGQSIALGPFLLSGFALAGALLCWPAPALTV